jgi:hypothetical protein
MAKYDIAEHWEDMSPGQKARVINLASDEQLMKWASDPDCNQELICRAALAKADIRDLLVTRQVPRPTNERAVGISDPTMTNAQRAQMLFDPRSDVSADARHIAVAVESSGRRIVKHLWIIFVLLPGVLAILYEIIR